MLTTNEKDLVHTASGHYRLIKGTVHLSKRSIKRRQINIQLLSRHSMIIQLFILIKLNLIKKLGKD